MQYKKPEYINMIENFIDDYKDANGGNTPSVREISAHVGLAISTVSSYLTHMRAQGIISYEGHRNISTRRSSSGNDYYRVPVLGSVSCGVPKYAEENIQEYIRLPLSLLGRGDFFALRAKGDSMINAGIEDGDFVFVRKQDTAEYNQIVVALVDDEATLKRFRPENGIFRLHAENPNYDDIIVESCIIQGVAVKVLKNLD